MKKTILLFQRTKPELNSKEVQLLSEYAAGKGLDLSTDIEFKTSTATTSGSHHLVCRTHQPTLLLVLCPFITHHTDRRLPFELTAGSRLMAPHIRVNFSTLEAFLEDYPSASSFARSRAA